MALDDSDDLALRTIAAFLRAAVPFDVDADALLKVYEDPRDLLVFSAGELPALAIYRQSETRFRRNSVDYAQRITVAFDYVLPATGKERRAARWPVLQRVWNSIVDLVIDGHHANVEDGVDVLEAASITADRNSPTVEYGFADHGGQSYPIARGRILIDYVPASVDLATIDKFLQFHASYDLVQTATSADTPAQPGVSTGTVPVETNLEGYTPP